MGWSVTGRRLGGAPVEFGGVTDQPPPDSRAPERQPEAEHPKPTRLVLARHAVTAQTGPMLSGRAPGIDLSDTGREQAKALGERLADAAGRGGLRQPDRAHHADGRSGRASTTGSRCRRCRASSKPTTASGPAASSPTSPRPTSGRRCSARRRARGFPTASRWPRCSRAWSPRSRRSSPQHPGELVVVVSHADPIKAAIAHYTGVHLDLFQRIVVSPASVTVFELSAHGAAMVKCNDTGIARRARLPEPADGRGRRTRRRTATPARSPRR